MAQDQTPLPSPAPESDPRLESGTGAHTQPGKLSLWGWVALILTLAAMAVVLVRDAGGFRWAATGVALENLGQILNNSWQFPGEAVLGVIFGGIELVGIFAVGSLLLSWRPWRRMLPLPAERLALALPVGAVLFSLAVLGLGLAGLARAEAMIALMIVFIAVGGIGARRGLGRDLAAAGGAIRRGLPRPRLLAGLIVLVFLVAIPYALSPTVESDELRYHLAAPATWLREGRIHYLPYQAFSNFPMLGEMLFMAALPLGGAAAVKLMHLAFLPVCMGLIFLIARRLTGAGKNKNNGAATAAGLAFALVPTVPVLAAWGFIDIFVVAYFLGFVYLTGRALARPGRAAGTLIGLMVAGAVGTKYTMLPLTGGLGAVWAVLLAIRLRKYNQASRRCVRLVAGVGVVAALLGGAWFVKNAIWTGNPVYPLAWGVFHGGEWSAVNQKFYTDKAHANCGMHLTTPGGPLPAGPVGQLAELLITPWTTEFYIFRFESNPLGPLPLLAVILCLGGLVIDRRKIAPARIFQFWVVFCLLASWVLWFFTYQSNRLLLPTVGLALALGGGALARWGRVAPRRAVMAIHVLLALAAIYSFTFFFTDFFYPSRPASDKSPGWAAGLGFYRPEDCLARKLAYWRPAKWLSAHAQPGERALLVGEHRTMHFDLPVVASDWFDTPQALVWIRATRNNNEMLDRLHAEGVRYIFFNAGELGLYYEKYFAPRFRPEELRRFTELWDSPRLAKVHEEGAGQTQVIIYEIQ